MIVRFDTSGNFLEKYVYPVGIGPASGVMPNNSLIHYSSSLFYGPKLGNPVVSFPPNISYIALIGDPYVRPGQPVSLQYNPADSSLNAVPGSGCQVYQFFVNGRVIGSSNGPTLKLTLPRDTGTYTVKVNWQGGAISESKPVLIDEKGVVAARAILAKPLFQAFPNPASNSVTVFCPTSGTLLFQNVLGRTLSTYEVKSKSTFDLDLSTLSSGLYHLRLGANHINLVKE
jgi:hypothetical protein